MYTTEGVTSTELVFLAQWLKDTDTDTSENTKATLIEVLLCAVWLCGDFLYL